MGSRRANRLLLALGVVAASIGGCAGCDTGSSTARPDFSAVDAHVADLMENLDLPGAAIRVTWRGEVVHDRTWGSYTAGTAVPSASASKWLTAATVMTLADDGLVDLDTPIVRYLAGVAGFDDAVESHDGIGAITLRQLLSHTSGLTPEHACVANLDTTLTQCATEVLAGGLTLDPGEFAYGSPAFQVAGLVAETVTGQPWPVLFEDRIGGPLDMGATRWGDIRGTPTSNPDLGAGAVTTLHDYAAFTSMMLDRGAYRGERVLSERSVREIEEPVTKMGDPADREYALGCQTLKLEDGTVVWSSPGLFGFRPWYERDRNLAVVMVMDRMNGDIVNEVAGDGPLHRAVRAAVDAIA